MRAVGEQGIDDVGQEWAARQRNIKQTKQKSEDEQWHGRLTGHRSVKKCTQEKGRVTFMRPDTGAYICKIKVHRQHYRLGELMRKW